MLTWKEIACLVSGLDSDSCEKRLSSSTLLQCKKEQDKAKMGGQLHAGQLRYHDFAKWRELHERRGPPRMTMTLSIPSHKAFTINIAPQNHSQPQRRHFLSMDTDPLKKLERQANHNPSSPEMQYEFIEQLSQKYPETAVERYARKEFVVDDYLARLYLGAMQRSNQFSHFNLEHFIERTQLQPLQRQALAQLQPTIHGMTKAKQVTAVLNVLQNPLSSSLPTGSTTTGTVGATLSNMYSANVPQQLRGTDPKKPLFVSLQQSQSFSATAAGIVGRILISVILVSALVAVMDEKGVGRSLGMNGGSKHVQEAEGTNVRFCDVKGVTEAKAELEEIVLYLKDPSRFTRLGGKLPRGLLLTGPPGTGKTLLAKAIAGEAGVPFFFSSGSQFEEVYVGLGAKRIRELFEAAKKKAPAIIFIDEIDAVGGTRKLKDQSALKMTLNELLVQLDGFDENDGIIVIGATNFVESLDKALLRPGRFDKHVTVPLPDVGGRKEILEMYAQKTKLAKDVDLNVLARGTTGFSGADLFNLMNQAALKASVDGLNSITMAVFEYAKDKILMGAERRTAVITAETARCTAYHEAGHALVATLTDGADPIHKATIMPRGASLGMVTMLPDGDQTSQSKKGMLAFMDVAMGGRVAEELVFGQENVTSGAMSDIHNATRIARNMVTKFGFSDQVGLVYYGGEIGEEASSETRAKIDLEVKRMTDAAYQRAKELLNKHSKEHHLLAETLLEYETLTGEEVRELIKRGVKPKRPVINKEGGQRGDTSVIGASGTSSTKQPLHGRGQR